ncbi:uncharacterized protein EV422DRAFT_419612 [Fimicolochytrium jonesii]|uniref:uncharacterized protein n=1 Tax=Fimicolochytrium jonesii TaxID=1396493 RepID=UPI0022FED3AF|nr:uncharacterized protein EV422DRAFT_419612 [Fimicolochytrium jonesii]KAI8822168.1 hypothetical protein EV422DRAFT_419612 [Fimicolochytrium jonesii]
MKCSSVPLLLLNGLLFAAEGLAAPSVHMRPKRRQLAPIVGAVVSSLPIALPPVVSPLVAVNPSAAAPAVTDGARTVLQGPTPTAAAPDSARAPSSAAAATTAPAASTAIAQQQQQPTEQRITSETPTASSAPTVISSAAAVIVSATSTQTPDNAPVTPTLPASTSLPPAVPTSQSVTPTIPAAASQTPTTQPIAAIPTTPGAINAAPTLAVSAATKSGAAGGPRATELADKSKPTTSTSTPSPAANSTSAPQETRKPLSTSSITLLSIAGLTFLLAVIGIYVFRKLGLRKSEEFKNRLRNRFTVFNFAGGHKAAARGHETTPQGTLERLNTTRSFTSDASLPIPGERSYAQMSPYGHQFLAPSLQPPAMAYQGYHMGHGPYANTDYSDYPTYGLADRRML